MKAPLEPAAITAAVQETLRRQKPPRLGELVKRWRYRFSLDDAAPKLTPETVRFLARFGVLDAGTDPAVQQKGFVAWLHSASRRTGDAPGVLAAWLQLFAAGEYGVLESGICDRQPRCGECGLRESCRFLLAGASDARTFGADLSKALARGASAGLRLAELLAFLLAGEKSGAGALARAEVLLKENGGLRGALEAAAEASGAAAALPEAERARLHALAQVVKLWAEERAEHGVAFRRGKDFFELYHLRLRELKQEVFIVAMLDQKNRLIGDEQVSLGTLSETLVHPREVFSQAIAKRAAAIAVIHNHPSGDPTPSPADKAITRRLDSVAKTVGIRLLDHIIIGDGRFVSFVDENLLQS